MQKKQNIEKTKCGRDNLENTECGEDKRGHKDKKIKQKETKHRTDKMLKRKSV